MRKPAATFEDLAVWRKARLFAPAFRRLSRTFPRSETYGLSSQVRRDAVSIAGNIAEGFRKRGGADKFRFFNIAQGSIGDCRHYPIIAEDLDHGDVSEASRLPKEVSKVLVAYSRSILNSDS